jgi:hypothetical protein
MWRGGLIASLGCSGTTLKRRLAFLQVKSVCMLDCRGPRSSSFCLFQLEAVFRSTAYTMPLDGKDQRGKSVVWPPIGGLAGGRLSRKPHGQWDQPPTTITSRVDVFGSTLPPPSASRSEAVSFILVGVLCCTGVESSGDG